MPRLPRPSRALPWAAAATLAVGAVVAPASAATAPEPHGDTGRTTSGAVVPPRPGDVEEDSHASSGRVEVTGSPGEWVTGGTTHRWTDARSMSLTGDTTGLTLDTKGSDGGWSLTVYPAKGEQLAVGTTYVAGAGTPQGPAEGVATLAVSGLGRWCGTRAGSSTFRVDALTPGEAGLPRRADVSFHLDCVDPAGSIDGHAVMTNRPKVAVQARTTAFVRGRDGLLRANVVATCSRPSRPSLTIAGRQGERAGAIVLDDVRCVPGRLNGYLVPLLELDALGGPDPVPFTSGSAHATTEAYVVDGLYTPRGVDVITVTKGDVRVRPLRSLAGLHVLRVAQAARDRHRDR